ncbi:hypothetical protein ACFBZI_00950 [Moraxella sp. ZJ142]|uniref:hypothetical protein n=1 Tax=Moraxella marmotae TaxID=3344520 RepID=UPI0035D40EA9
MLTVDNDGVVIALNGQVNDLMFWWSLVLLVVGVAVAWVCFIAPVAYAIGALAVFAVMMFVFNHKRNQLKTCHTFAQGRLRLTPRRFEIDNKALTLTDKAVIEQQAGWLIVKDGMVEYRFTGFDDNKEMMIAQQVLAGKSIQANQVAVKLVSR